VEKGKEQGKRNPCEGEKREKGVDRSVGPSQVYVAPSNTVLCLKMEFDLRETPCEEFQWQKIPGNRTAKAEIVCVKDVARNREGLTVQGERNHIK